MRSENKCELCGATEKLTVHHLSYANLYDEKDDELLTLCWPCHEKWQRIADDLRLRRANLYKSCLEDSSFIKRDDDILAHAELELLGAGKKQNLNHLASCLRQSTSPVYSDAANGTKHLQRLSELRQASQLRTKKDLTEYVRAQINAHVQVEMDGSYRFIPFDAISIDWFYTELFSYYKGEETQLFGIPERSSIRSVTPGLDMRYQTKSNLCLIVDCEGLKPGPWSYTKCIHDRPLDTFPVPTIFNCSTQKSMSK